MSDQDSNPKQTGHTPRCPKCQSERVTLAFCNGLGTTGISARCREGNGCSWYSTSYEFTLAEENAQLRKALLSVEGLFSDGSPFYIAKVGNRITNGDQDVIDKAFMLAKAALEQK